MVITANPPKFDKRQPSRGDYDAIVYIQDGEVIAEDCDGLEIDSGVAGADDSTVINSAMSFLTNGGHLHISSGRYTCNADITISKSNILITGDGRNSTVLVAATGCTSVISVIGFIRNLEIDSIGIDCNSIADYGVASDLYGMGQSVLKYINICEANVAGINLGGSVGDSFFAHLYIDDCAGYGIKALSIGDDQFSDIYITNCAAGYIYLDSSGGLYFSNVHCWGHYVSWNGRARDSLTGIVGVNTTSHIHFDKLYLEQVTSDHMMHFSSDADYYPSSITVANSYIISNTSTPANTYDLIHIAGTGSQPGGRVLLENNELDASMGDEARYNIFLSNMEDVIITGNYMKNYHHEYVCLDNCTNVVNTNNTSPDLEHVVGVDKEVDSTIWTNTTGAANRCYLGRFKNLFFGVVSEIWVRSTGSANVRVVIYDESEGFLPHTVLASSATTAIVEGWNRIAISSASLEANSFCWIGFNCDALGKCQRRDTGGISAYYDVSMETDFTDDPTTTPGTYMLAVDAVGVIPGEHEFKKKAYGASTGTGAEQTIAHGLYITPVRQQIILSAGSATANPYHSKDPDRTYFYVTAGDGQPWYWNIP